MVQTCIFNTYHSEGEFQYMALLDTFGSLKLRYFDVIHFHLNFKIETIVLSWLCTVEAHHNLYMTLDILYSISWNLPGSLLSYSVCLYT